MSGAARAKWLFAGALGLALACGSDSDAETVPAKKSQRGAFVSQEAPKEEAPPPEVLTKKKRRDEERPSEAKVETPEEKPKERDFPAELSAALGGSAGCVKARPSKSGPQEISISVDAHVTATGFVSRAYARSSQLDADELECVRKQAGALRLQGPIEDAPRTITTTLTLKMKPPPAPPAEAAPEAAAPPATPEEAAQPTTGY